MIYLYSIKGETPAKKNSRITLRNGRTIPSKNYQAWHIGAVSQIMTQKRPQEPIAQEVLIVVHFYHGDKRRRDSDNGLSSILDLLTDCKVLADDNWQIVRQIAVANFYDKDNARAEITVQEV